MMEYSDSLVLMFLTEMFFLTLLVLVGETEWLSYHWYML